MARKPILCAGCPHRTTGYALKTAVKKIRSNTGKNVYFYQDIGCYTLLALPPFSFANAKYCMGSSIALAQGVAQTSESLNIAIIGDGTFFHSGIPALLNGIYNKTPILVLILDNGWIGMTGQQPHPGSDTRYYKEGPLKKSINLEELLQGTGAITTVINHNENEVEHYYPKLKDIIYEKGIDVLENEPNINPKLREIPNLYLTPHSAFYSDESFVELRQKCALEIRRVLTGGEARNVVNRQYMRRSV